MAAQDSVLSDHLLIPRPYPLLMTADIEYSLFGGAEWSKRPGPSRPSPAPPAPRAARPSSPRHPEMTVPPGQAAGPL
ncbi:hypothetical protein FIBSPDRAFT_269839 [Athelia psychrophila]|uniref:Uncharacterized protein n=1 Tax=Athelia psychrophila TaxID=1759441 RepID=A0A165X0Q4_9AGAM|nr:hypothetical protein FIBSPDRAFT_269839 [Fibularhizoctonia sp. CBS 109695]